MYGQVIKPSGGAFVLVIVEISGFIGIVEDLS